MHPGGAAAGIKPRAVPARRAWPRVVEDTERPDRCQVWPERTWQQPKVFEGLEVPPCRYCRGRRGLRRGGTGGGATGLWKRRGRRAGVWMAALDRRQRQKAAGVRRASAVLSEASPAFGTRSG